MSGMLKQVKSRQRIYSRDEVIRKHIYFPKSFIEDFRLLKKELKEFSGQTITLSHVLREGGSNYIRHLRVLMTKAKKGHLHAKPRLQRGKHALIGR
jgi:hypothetical protein